MKSLLVTLLLTASLPSLFIGCGGGSKKTALDATAFTAAFQSASGEMKSNATTVSTAIKSGDLASAASALEKMVKAGGFSPEQQNAVSDIVVTMQMVTYEEDKKYSDDLRNKLSDLAGSLVGSAPVSK